MEELCHPTLHPCSRQPPTPHPPPHPCLAGSFVCFGLYPRFLVLALMSGQMLLLLSVLLLPLLLRAWLLLLCWGLIAGLTSRT